MFFFFFDEYNETNENNIEYHYLSQFNKFGIDDKSEQVKFYDSSGLLKKKDTKDQTDEEFQVIDFKRLISEKVRKIIYGEKYSNIVFLAGAGASVVGNNLKYGKTVRMIAEDIFEKLPKEEDVYSLEELAKQCQYHNGDILKSEEYGTDELRDSFNLEDFLSALFHYRPFVIDDNKIKFENSIKAILKMIKENTNYSYNNKFLKHGSLLNFLSRLSGKNGNKFSVVTTNYDVLIEQAAADNNFIVFDGFNFTPNPKFDSSMFEWNLVKEVQNINTREVEYKDKVFNLLKIHGSLTWEKEDNGDILRKNKDIIDDTDKMVMIFPSSDKYAQSYQEPYFELFSKFQELLKRPNTLLISSGFSFADAHIAKIVTQSLKNNSSLRLLVTDYNIDPNRAWNKDIGAFEDILEDDSRFNQNWSELVSLMNEGYPVTFLKATMNDDLVDYLDGRYLDSED